MRIVLFFVSYLYIENGKLYESPYFKRLELMNQTIAILLLDVMILFTPLLNDGNPDDHNLGSVSDKKRAD